MTDTPDLEVNVVKPLDIPATPSTRLAEEHHSQLKSIAKLPLVLLVLIAALFIAGFINPVWVPTLNLIALTLSAATVLFAGVFMFFVIRARKNLAVMVQSVAATVLPLLQEKYEVDVTEELIVALMSGAKLPLIVQGELKRVQLVNVGKQAKLMEITSL